MSTHRHSVFAEAWRQDIESILPGDPVSQREWAAQALFVCASKTPADQWKEPLRLDSEAAKRRISEIPPEIARLHRGVSGIRNDLNHGGLLVNAAKPSVLQKKLFDSIRILEEYLPPFSTSPKPNIPCP